MTVAEILPFPEEQDRTIIQALVRTRAEGKIGEAEFSRAVADRLRLYGIRTLVCGTFTVRDCGSFETSRGLFPVVAITARQRSQSDTCPACGSKPGRWLRGDHDITGMCLGCGCVYSWPVTNEENGL